jgi:hypothetical protein
MSYLSKRIAALLSAVPVSESKAAELPNSVTLKAGPKDSNRSMVHRLVEATRGATSGRLVERFCVTGSTYTGDGRVTLRFA